MTQQLPIIIQLQLDASDAAISVTSLLRKAKIIATKLNLTEFLRWIDHELNGYQDTLARDLPSYRQLHGEPYAFNPFHGWQPIMFHSAEQRQSYTYAPNGQAIGPMEEMLNSKNKDGYIIFSSPEAQQALQKAIDNEANVQIRLASTQVHGILDAVRNTILDWALKLEKAGILGDNLQFTPKEVKEATSVTQNITNNINNIGTVSGNANVQISQVSSANLDISKVKSFIDEAQKSVALLPDSSRDDVQKNLEEIKSELNKPEDKQDKTKMAAALESARKICEGITSSVIAQGIVALIRQMS